MPASPDVVYLCIFLLRAGVIFHISQVLEALFLISVTVDKVLFVFQLKNISEKSKEWK